MSDVLRIDVVDEAKRLAHTLLEADSVLRALVAEVERLRAIETATRAAYCAEKAWREGGGMNAELAGTMCDARHRLRELLEKEGAA